MRIVFMGTPDFAVPSLEALIEHHDVAVVFTRADAVRSRGKKLEPSPVKKCAFESGIKVYETYKITDEYISEVKELSPDLICVAAYGCILPDALLQIPRFGAINVHASLLPLYRGAAPIQRSILAGDERIGVSIMKIAHELDAGDYCAQTSIANDGSSFEKIISELAKLGASILLDAIDNIINSTVSWTTQDISKVTFAPKIEKGELNIDTNKSALQNLRRVQASSDASTSKFFLSDRGIRVLEAALPLDSPSVGIGKIIADKKRVLYGCMDGALELIRVKPDGKGGMRAADWARGAHL